MNLRSLHLQRLDVHGHSGRWQDAALELLTIGWGAEVIAAVLFVFFLGNLANLYFRK